MSWKWRARGIIKAKASKPNSLKQDYIKLYENILTQSLSLKGAKSHHLNRTLLNLDNLDMTKLKTNKINYGKITTTRNCSSAWFATPRNITKSFSGDFQNSLQIERNLKIPAHGGRKIHKLKKTRVVRDGTD